MVNVVEGTELWLACVCQRMEELYPGKSEHAHERERGGFRVENVNFRDALTFLHYVIF